MTPAEITKQLGSISTAVYGLSSKLRKAQEQRDRWRAKHYENMKVINRYQRELAEARTNLRNAKK